MASLRRLRFVLILLTAVMTVVGGSVTSATAATPTPTPHERGSAGGLADIPRHTAPPAGVADLAPTADPAATARTEPSRLTAEALAGKAKASTGFRSPNQKPVATQVSGQASPKPAGPVAPAATRPLATTFPGIADTRSAPPDTIMAAGPSNIIVAVNVHVAVYNKVGTQLSMTPLSDVFSAEGQVARDRIFDPWVVYDPYVDRFWLLALSFNDNPNRSTILLAVSKTSDATAGWDTTSIDGTLNGDDPTDNWCDHAKLGFDTQAIYITCVMFAFPTNSREFEYAKIKVMTKGQLLSGPCCTWWDFWDLREGFLGLDLVGVIQPARMFGATDADGMYFVDAHGAGDDGDELEVWHLTNPGNCCGDNPSAPDLEQDGRDVGAYDPAPDARQQGSSNRLDTIDTRVQYAFWQDEHLSTGQAIACPEVNAACVAYTEIDVSNYPDMSVVNDFVIPENESIDRFFPAADPNGGGDKAMVYSISGPNRFAGTSFVTIPPSSTCTNCIRSEISTASGLAPYDSRNQRWGDYSGASGDPNGEGVWVAGEFASTGNSWGTQVALTMDRIPTAITYTGPLGAATDATIELSANLIRATGGSPAPLAGAPITFFVGIQVCSATTDANGRATCSLTLNQPNGTVDVEAIFPGDPDHGVAFATHRFVIGVAGRITPTFTYTGDTSGEFQARANLSARLIDPRDGSGSSVIRSRSPSAPSPARGPPMSPALPAAHSYSSSGQAPTPSQPTSPATRLSHRQRSALPSPSPKAARSPRWPPRRTRPTSARTSPSRPP